jgi:hypothetical protein
MFVAAASTASRRVKLIHLQDDAALPANDATPAQLKVEAKLRRTEAPRSVGASNTKTRLVPSDEKLAFTSRGGLGGLWKPVSRKAVVADRYRSEPLSCRAIRM